MSEGAIRPELGDFSSIVCLKAIVTGLEDIMGIPAARGNLILAGRKRGQKIAQSLSLTKTEKPLDEWSKMVADAIGENGTKLCKIQNISQNDKTIIVDLSDTVCSAGEDEGSPRQLTFTLGAIQGAIEEIMDVRLGAKQIGSVLRGQEFDTIEFTIR